MKKKFAAIILSIACICAMFTSCGESEYEIVEKALRKTRKLDSISAEMKTNIEVETQGTKISIPTTVKIKANDIKSENPTILTDVSMKMSGNQVDMQFYQEDNWGYINISDMKYKTKIGENSQYNYINDVKNLIKDVPDELLKKANIEKGENGSSTVEVKIPSKTFEKKYENLITNVSENTGVATKEAEISDGVVKITFKDGYVTSYSLKFEMKIDGKNFSRTAKVETSIKYSDLGKKVKINPPKNYKSYEELS